MAVGIHALIEQRQAEPGRVGFVEGATGRSLTWADVAERSRAWREAGHRLGGWRVGLMFADPLEMTAAVLGAMGAGVTAAPLNPAATSAELADQIATLGLVAVVADEVDATLEAAAASAGANVWRGEQGQLRRPPRVRVARADSRVKGPPWCWRAREPRESPRSLL